MTNTYFRLDKRLFLVGQEVTTANECSAKFVDIAKRVEATLESKRPANKKRRDQCLFVFEDEKCAKKHWSKMKDGKLYKVSINESAISHRGDMAQMDVMKLLGASGKNMIEVAEDYWRGQKSAYPEIEIMVPSAVVTEVMSTCDKERQDHLKESWGFKQ